MSAALPPPEPSEPDGLDIAFALILAGALVGYFVGFLVGVRFG